MDNIDEKKNELIKPDSRNKSVGITLESLREELDLVTVGPKVPKDVVNMTELARKLCLYGYFEYDFYSVSMLYGCLAIELALKFKLIDDLPPEVQMLKKSKREKVKTKLSELSKRWSKGWRIEGLKSVSGTLYSLLTWGKGQGIIPERLLYICKHLHTLRNSWAHPDFKEVVTPPMAVSLYLRMIDFINCLFDRTSWRREPEIFVRERAYYRKIIEEARNFENRINK